MTSTPVTFTPDAVDDAAAVGCPACGHPWSVHDQTGTRWCAATRLGVGARDCICSGAVTPARTLSHY